MSEIKYKCDYADERNKQRYCAHKRCKCNGCGDIFTVPGDNDRLEVIERKDVCKESSLFGNYYFVLTANDVANLIAGKCLGMTGEEYNIFLSYENGGVNDA